MNALTAKHALTTLTAALISTAAAQEISTSLPLTSVGDKLLWTVGDQDLHLVVGMSGRVQLDVYSAQFDQTDYRSPDEYGDESYSANPVTSTFLLIDAAGKVVKSQNFGMGKPDWQTFLNADLPAGTYTLRVSTEGNGKNTFAIRLNSISAAVEADRLNVNVRAKDWIPALNVTNPGGTLGLKMYDGDGPTELEAQLRDAAGNVYPLKVSGNLGFDTLDIPEAAGNYTLYLRQAATAKQWSNTVGFSLSSGAITVVQTATGGLQAIAELVLPDGNIPTSADVSVTDAKNREVPLAVPDGGSGSRLVEPLGVYGVKVAPVVGADVTYTTDANSSDNLPGTPSDTVRVIKDKTALVKVQIKPDVALSFTADKTQVCVGDVVTFTAQATTAFERQPLNASLRVALPGTLTTSSDTTLTAKVDAANPAVLKFEAKATAAGTLDVSAALAPWNKSQKLGVEVLPTATQIELRRSDLTPALPGDVVTVTLSVHNTSGVAAPYKLVDDPGRGLDALDPVIFSGTLQPGESKTLSYRARVVGAAGASSSLQATLSSNCDSAQQVAGGLVIATPAPTPPEATSEVPVPVVVMARSSTVRIPFDAPKSAAQLIVAHTPPVGGTYVAGSSQLNGKATADPQVGPSGRLYWTTPGAPRGVLTYGVKHQDALPALDSPALVGRYAQGKQEMLVGNVDLSDLAAATAIGAQAATENEGAVRLPLAGTVFRDRDRVTVVVQGRVSDTALPTINGTAIAASALGQTSLDDQDSSARREFYGVQLRPGENVVGYGDQSVKVYLASSPVTAQITPVQLVADGIQPIQLKLKLLDINGLTPGTPTVTVESSLEPLTRDAQPQVASYQLKLTDGEGLLELPPISAPTRFTVRVLVGSGVITRSFEATPSSTKVGVGFVSGTVSLGGSGLAYEARGQGYFETPLGAGKLYVAGAAAVRGGAGQVATSTAADGTVTSTSTALDTAPTLDPAQGLPSSANPLLRYPGYGDSSSEQIPLQGLDPVAFRYEHPDFSVSYRQAPLPIDVFSVGGTVTALSGYSRSNPQVSGFVAALPGGTVTDDLRANGTRVVKLSQKNVLQDSETVDLVHTDHLSGAQTLTRLTPFVDYTVDPVAGVLYFSRPVDLLDTEGNAQSLKIVYRITSTDGNRQLAFGAQVGEKIGENLSVAAAAVRIGTVTSVGVRARYSSDTLNGDLLAAYADGMLVNGTLSGKTDALTYAASVRYQDQGYDGLNAVQSGVAASASVDAKLTQNFGVKLDASYADGSYQLGRDTSGTVGTATTNQGGLVSLQGRYYAGPLKLGAGVQAGFGGQSGVSALLSAGYTSGAVDLSIDHAQPIGAGTLNPVTTAAAKVQIAENVTLIARETLDWGGTNPDGTTDPLTQQASVGLQTKLGGTNLSAAYDLPNSAGSGNRARFGVDTVLPLDDKFSVNLSGSYLYNLTTATGDWNAGSSVRYTGDKLVASAGVDAATNAGAFRTVLKAGLSYSLNDQWSVTLDGTKVLGAADQAGDRFAVSTALRAGPWQGLAYLRYQDGVLAGADAQVVGEANVEYHQPQFAMRAGVAGRMLLADTGSLTFQPSVSGMYYLNDYLGVGVAGRAVYQPSTGYSAYSLGLEGSVRALPGTWITVGYNPIGFDGISSNVSTRQGTYVRLDLLLDEGQRK
ncbi:DUF11 domain-containing protein [Deinococcus ruber]|uniref:DUF11 domain-containing protein n=1 Tax=Deinococcus ruber TaxID=1848197 RepID=A0A918C487_9DEIO|nr:DUF11 domain-containing protein [Deinococcus ruber]GGR05040.1 hypothetical protein GCM10008957_17430 [Deinococcus ruber]